MGSLDTPPQWESFATELNCPLCGYNLRGLNEPRCPECGFAFRWAELLDARREQHPFLFEHGRGRNLRTFTSTYVRSCFPRRFWQKVTPANTVNVRRLMIYWLLASLPVLGIVAVQFGQTFYRTAARNQQVRAQLLLMSSTPRSGSPFAPRSSQVRSTPTLSITPAQLNAYFPPVGSWRFLRQVWLRQSHATPASVGAALIVAGWPWLTMLTLMIFQISMRRAQVRRVHVMRVIGYSCDFALVLLVWVALLSKQYSSSPYLRSRARSWPLNTDVGQLLFLTAAGCAAVGGYRLTIAYRRYLRFHLPAATVWASQVICLLIVLVIVTQVTAVF